MPTPAARKTDPTSHGGAITAGAPTVSVDNLPAARLGDALVCLNPIPFPPPVIILAYLMYKRRRFTLPHEAPSDCVCVQEGL
jgi:hypothetical protein